MTECSDHEGQCGIAHSCGARANWRRVNDVVANALRRVSLAEMALPPAADGAAPRRAIPLALSAG